MSVPQDIQELKRRAALAALEFVQDGMVVGLGTGSTARELILALAERVKGGFQITGVPTSRETAALARQYGIPLLDDEAAWSIDVAIDGADQVDPSFNLIKGGGGALLREKIVAAAARRFVVVVDHSKRVPVLGHPFPLPVEVMPFGLRRTARHIEDLGIKTVLREKDRRAFRTDGDHYILDLHIERIEDPAALERTLTLIPGVVETGLFVGRTGVLIVGTPDGVDVLTTEGHGGSL